MYTMIYRENDNEKWHTWNLLSHKTECGIDMKLMAKSKKIGCRCCGGEEDPDVSTVCLICFGFLPIERLIKKEK